jgi:AraC-like DNA-binding protein
MDVQWVIRYCIMLAIIGINYVYLCAGHDHTRGFTQQWFVILMLVYSTEQILYRKDPWQHLRATAQEQESEDMTDIQQANAAYKVAIEAWLEQDKPYLNPDFQLTDLRQVLPLNRTYLSQLINTEYGCSFYRFITRYRIQEAKRLMTEQPDMKVQDIAQQSGFSDRKVFSRTFTRETGLNPTKWMATCHNS